MRRLGPPATARPVAAEPSPGADPFVDHVRAAYCFNRDLHERRRGSPRGPIYRPPASYEGRPSRGPEDRKRPAAWQLLAAYFREHRVEDPYQYAALAFQSLPFVDALPPEPLNLKGVKHMNRWRKRRHLFSGELADRWLWQTQQLRAALGGQDAEAVLLDDQSGLSPLFRYCVAETAAARPLARLQELLLTEAARQYSCRRMEYDRLLGDTLPAFVRRTVEGWALRLTEGARRG